MKITVDMSDSEMTEICFFTGESKKGPAIRKMVTDALMLKRREQLAQKFILGEWGTDLTTSETTQSKETQAAEQLEQKGAPC